MVKKTLKISFVLMLAFTMVFTNTENTTIVAEEMSDGVYVIENYTYQYKHPITGNKIDGSAPSEQAESAGINMMNRVMDSNQKIIVEKNGTQVYVYVSLNTDLEIATYKLEDFKVKLYTNDTDESATDTTFEKVGSYVVSEDGEDDITYTTYKIAIDSLSTLISPQFTVMNETGFFISINQDATTKIETAKVNTLLAQVDALDASLYEATSYKAVDEAYKNAKAIVSSPLSTQAQIDAATTALETAISALKTLTTTGIALKDGTYTIDVSVWNATEDKASMVDSAIDGVATIVVKNGEVNVTINLKESTMGYVPGFKLVAADGSYIDIAASKKDSDGNTIQIQFTLDSLEEFVDIRIMTGETSSMPARFKFDLSSIKAVANTTDKIGNQSQDPALNNKETNKSINTGDSTNTQILFHTLMASAIVGAFISRKRLSHHK